MKYKKRAGLLTFHSAFNEGSILQAYCLNQLIRKQLNLDAEIVDQNYKSRLDFYGSVFQSERTIVLQDYIKKLPLSNQSFIDKDKETFDYINRSYNCLFIGSDEVWKVKIPTKRLYPPFPNVYWPNKELRIPCLGYAVCIGDTDWEKLPNSILYQMVESIKSFDLLGVRDSRTYNFLKWLDVVENYNISITPDPALSVDFSNHLDLSLLKRKLVKLGVNFEKKRIGIYCPQNPIIKKVIQYLKKREIQTIAISDNCGDVDLCLSDVGFTPIEWAFIPHFMSYCISYRMHGCISNIINNTPFIALDLRNKPELSGKTKIHDLMESFHLHNYYWGNSMHDESDIINKCDMLIDNNWPFKQIELILNNKREVAHNYFNNAKTIIEKT
ncbi:MAG: polysaccharide pyruvyl transferase family protein [bacterium]